MSGTANLPNIHLLGIQGSGKGTQSALLVKRYQLTYVGSGNLLRQRAAVSDPFGERLSALLHAGSLVPDVVLYATVEEALRTNPPQVGLVADGVIRTASQYAQFKEAWELLGFSQPLLVYLELDEETASARVAKRAEEVQRGENVEHHRTYSGKAAQRADDNPRSLSERFAIFHEMTRPIVDLFEGEGRCLRFDASLSVEELHRAISAGIEHHYPSLNRAKQDA